jgi:hypothetical protein
MTNKNFPRDQHPIQAELRGLARAARNVSRRRLQQLAAGAATTTLLAGLSVSPAFAATIVDGCPPDQVCKPDLSALLEEGQAAESLSLNFTKISVQYKDLAIKLDQAVKIDFLKLTGADKTIKLEFLKIMQGALKLQDEALFLKIGAMKLNGDGIKLVKDVSAITDGTSKLSDKALFLKLQQLDTLGLKIDGLEGSLSKNADALQSDYLKLVDEFQNLTSPPTTIG